ncbi:iron-containing alcohol dehydrogenase [Chloroflexota bacterium]
MKETISLQIPYTIFGRGSISSLTQMIADAAVNKVLIMTDKGLMKTGKVIKLLPLLNAAGCRHAIFDDCEPNTPSSVVEKCSQKVVDEGYDLLVGIGGGSVMDTAKIVSVVAYNQIPVRDIIGQVNVIMKSLPKILIPTTSGTGSEWSGAAMITDSTTGKKGIVNGPCNYADAVIIDSELTMGLPQNITADTGMDALTHAIEAYASPRHNIICDIFAEPAIRLISDNLFSAYSEDDIEARHNLSIAASMAITAFLRAGGGLNVHGIDALITEMTHLSHGAALSILLPHIMEFKRIEMPDRFAKLAKLMGQNIDNLTEMEAAEKSVEAVKNLMNQLGMKTRFSQVGLTAQDVEHLANEAWDRYSKRWQSSNLDFQDLRRLLSAAL